MRGTSVLFVWLFFTLHPWPPLRTLRATGSKRTPLRCRQQQSIRVWRLQSRLWGGGWIGERRLPSFQRALALSFCHSHLATSSHGGLHANGAGLHVRYGLIYRPWNNFRWLCHFCGDVRHHTHTKKLLQMKHLACLCARVCLTAWTNSLKIPLKTD